MKPLEGIKVVDLTSYLAAPTTEMCIRDSSGASATPA